MPDVLSCLDILPEAEPAILSVVTNECVGIGEKKPAPKHEDVVEEGMRVDFRLSEIIINYIRSLN